MIRAMMDRESLGGQEGSRGLGMILAGLAAVFFLGTMLLALLVAFQQNAPHRTGRVSSPARPRRATRPREGDGASGGEPPRSAQSTAHHPSAPAAHPPGFSNYPGNRMEGRAH